MNFLKMLAGTVLVIYGVSTVVGGVCHIALAGTIGGAVDALGGDKN